MVTGSKGALNIFKTIKTVMTLVMRAAKRVCSIEQTLQVHISGSLIPNLRIHHFVGHIQPVANETFV
jgi:hypothetical protein